MMSVEYANLYVVSFSVGAESGLAMVAAPNAAKAFQILVNSGSRYGDEYVLIQTRDIGMTSQCHYGLLLESYVNALEAYEAICSVLDRLKGVKGDRGNGITRIEETVVSHEDEGINVVTFYDVDGNQYSIQVRNGSKGRVGVESAAVDVDDTIGTPSCSVSLVGGVLSLSFSGIKGEKGEQGEIGPPARVINSLTIGGVNSALSAEMGKDIKLYIDRLDSSIDGAVFTGTAIESGIDISGFPGLVTDMG